jgi:hypothetical protein
MTCVCAQGVVVGQRDKGLLKAAPENSWPRITLGYWQPNRPSKNALGPTFHIGGLPVHQPSKIVTRLRELPRVLAILKRHEGVALACGACTPCTADSVNVVLHTWISG